LARVSIKTNTFICHGENIMAKLIKQEYQFTVKALYRQEESFEKLVKEMQNFKPPSLTQEQMEKKSLYKKQLYSINNVKEGEHREDLDKDVDLQFDTNFLVSHLYEEDLALLGLRG